MTGRRRVAVALAIATALRANAPPIGAQDREPSPRETVKIGIFDLGPFMMTTDSGAAGGASVDFWKTRIAPLMGVDVEISGPYPIPRLEKMLKEGTIDVIPYITKIPARDALFLYPSRTIDTITPCIIVRRDSAITSIERQEDLFGLKVGFITSAYIPPFLKHERITLELVTATDYRQINHQKLVNGRVDALLDINYKSYLFEMNRRGYAKDIRVIPLLQGQTSVYSIFQRTKRGMELRDRYETALASIEAGDFDAIVDRFIRDGR